MSEKLESRLLDEFKKFNKTNVGNVMRTIKDLDMSTNAKQGILPKMVNEFLCVGNDANIILREQIIQISGYFKKIIEFIQGQLKEMNDDLYITLYDNVSKDQNVFIKGLCLKITNVRLTKNGLEESRLHFHSQGDPSIMMKKTLLEHLQKITVATGSHEDITVEDFIIRLNPKTINDLVDIIIIAVDNFYKTFEELKEDNDNNDHYV